MQFAYSILLRELVGAGEVEPGDCETFQLVCPACREPVFKKTRARTDGGISHFLSHYRAETPDEKDCELRVDAISRDQAERFSMPGRGQTMDGFMSVLRDAIIRGQAFTQPPGEYAKSVNRLLAHPAFDQFAGYAREAVRVIPKLPDPRRTVSDMLAGFPRFADRSPFWHRRQASYVLDVLGHLTAPQVRQNLRVLAAAAYLSIGLSASSYRSRLAALPTDSGSGGEAAVNLIEALVKGRSEPAMHRLNLRWSGAGKAATREEAADRMAAVQVAIVGELAGPIVGILAAVPFPDLARDRNAVMPDADGLEALQALMGKLFGEMRRGVGMPGGTLADGEQGPRGGDTP